MAANRVYPISGNVTHDAFHRQFSGPDSFHVVFSGSEKLSPPDWYHAGQCLYVFPFHISNPGKLSLDITFLYDNFGAVVEQTESWPVLRNEKVLTKFPLEVCRGCPTRVAPPRFPPIPVQEQVPEEMSEIREMSGKKNGGTAAAAAVVAEAAAGFIAGSASNLRNRYDAYNLERSARLVDSTVVLTPDPDLPFCSRELAVQGAWLPAHPLDQQSWRRSNYTWTPLGCKYDKPLDLTCLLQQNQKKKNGKKTTTAKKFLFQGDTHLREVMVASPSVERIEEKFGETTTLTYLHDPLFAHSRSSGSSGGEKSDMIVANLGQWATGTKFLDQQWPTSKYHDKLRSLVEMIQQRARDLQDLEDEDEDFEYYSPGQYLDGDYIHGSAAGNGNGGYYDGDDDSEEDYGGEDSHSEDDDEYELERAKEYMRQRQQQKQQQQQEEEEKQQQQQQQQEQQEHQNQQREHGIVDKGIEENLEIIWWDEIEEENIDTRPSKPSRPSKIYHEEEEEEEQEEQGQDDFREYERDGKDRFYQGGGGGISRNQYGNRGKANNQRARVSYSGKDTNSPSRIRFPNSHIFRQSKHLKEHHPIGPLTEDQQEQEEEEIEQDHSSNNDNKNNNNSNKSNNNSNKSNNSDNSSSNKHLHGRHRYGAQKNVVHNYDSKLVRTDSTESGRSSSKSGNGNSVQALSSSRRGKTMSESGAERNDYQKVRRSLYRRDSHRLQRRAREVTRSTSTTASNDRKSRINRINRSRDRNGNNNYNYNNDRGSSGRETKLYRVSKSPSHSDEHSYNSNNYNYNYKNDKTNSNSNSKSSNKNKEPQENEKETLKMAWVGMVAFPESQPVKDRFMSSHDWRTIYRLRYWNQIAEEVMLLHDIRFMDFFSMTLSMIDTSPDRSHYFGTDAAEAMIEELQYKLGLCEDEANDE
ncbi:hypothetical protein BG004_003932 [Podila humilis]|nr:hypothetical protein BG004_003932 [Podila humilis]